MIAITQNRRHLSQKEVDWLLVFMNLLLGPTQVNNNHSCDFCRSTLLPSCSFFLSAPFPFPENSLAENWLPSIQVERTTWTSSTKPPIFFWWEEPSGHDERSLAVLTIFHGRKMLVPLTRVTQLHDWISLAQSLSHAA